jgi:hypothetical protein
MILSDLKIFTEDKGSFLWDDQTAHLPVTRIIDKVSDLRLHDLFLEYVRSFQNKLSPSFLLFFKLRVKLFYYRFKVLRF